MALGESAPFCKLIRLNHHFSASQQDLISMKTDYIGHNCPGPAPAKYRIVSMWEKFPLGALLFEKLLYRVLVSWDFCSECIWVQYQVFGCAFLGRSDPLGKHFRIHWILQLILQLTWGNISWSTLTNSKLRSKFFLVQVCTKIKEALNFPHNIREWKLWAQAEVKVTSSVLSVKLAPLANGICKVIWLNSISLWAKVR